MATWMDGLRGDPTPWLLDPEMPAVRHLALCQLFDRPATDPAVVEALTRAMATDPIAATLAAQQPEGYWDKPGAGYARKYTGTVWSVIFLAQMGADPTDPRIHAACSYVLSHSRASSGGFGASGSKELMAPPPSAVIHCLNGNLVHALVRFGWLDDERLQRAIAWEVRAITGEGMERWYRTGTSGPGFECAANEHLPCAWGAVKAINGLAAIPPDRRTRDVEQAIELGVEFLLSHDLAAAAYPMGWGNTRPNGSWFRPGFPSGYVTDVSQVLEVLVELGRVADPRAQPAIEWLLGLQDDDGRWTNRYAYNGKTWRDVEPQGASSRWVTLRALRILKAARPSPALTAMAGRG